MYLTESEKSLKRRNAIQYFFTLNKWLFLYNFLFIKTSLSRKGLFSATGRTLIWGKMRRMFYCLIPSVARSLHEKHKVSGGCSQCGTSCKLLFQCPAYDDNTGNCQAYKYRPLVCRLYPITPADIRDRDLANPNEPCGYQFGDDKQNSISV